MFTLLRLRRKNGPYCWAVCALTMSVAWLAILTLMC
jgi:hypothetical protein